VFRIEQNGRMSLGRPKPPTKGGSTPDEEVLQIGGLPSNWWGLVQGQPLGTTHHKLTAHSAVRT